MYRFTLCAILCLTMTCLPRVLDAQEGNEYGLRFISHEDIKDNRTGLLLTPEEGLRLEGDFTLGFDVRLHEAVQTFGYVFRLIAGEATNLDMISEVSTPAPKIRFVEGENTIAEFPIRTSSADPLRDKWIQVSVAVRPGAGEVTISVDSLSRTVPLGLDTDRYKIWFGVCDHPAFYSTDVPPMSLRDVKILGGGDRLLRHWELGRHDGDVALDVAGKHPAVAKNPVWLLDGYAHWRKKISTVIPERYLGMAARADEGVIYFAAGSHLAVYDNSRPEGLEVRETLAPMPFAVMPNQIVFDGAKGEIVAYELESRRTAALDPDVAGAPAWAEVDAATPIPRYWHHNAAFVPSSGKIVTFGGYGEHTYKSRMNVIGPDGGWDSFDLADRLPPRYLSGMAVTPDGELLIAGGYGNSSGLQSESPHNFYDIWRVDPATGEVESAGWLVRDTEDEHFVLGRDMVLGGDGETLYAIIYSDKRYASEIHLAGIELSTGHMVRYADAVPYQFSDVESFCTLALDRARREFLLVTMRQTGEGGTLVEIWSLDAPPLQIADTVQTPRKKAVAWWWSALVGFVALGAAVVVTVVLRRRRRRRAEAAEAGAVGGTAVVFNTPDYHKTYRVEKQPSSILLLGGFQVVDKNGRDITGNFTQTVRALFLLILLETYKGGRGISSQALGDILWFDKDPENARNNRNVNIHKLRTLLAEVGDADVSSSNSYWHLKLGEGIFCDYSTLLQVSREVARGGDDRQRVESLVALASLGKLLPNTQTEWSDAYKADFSARLIEQLMKIASAPGIKDDPQVQLRIADAILTHDNLDEDAMRMKCSALVRMGKKNQAKQAYNTFVADFKKTLDTTPDFDFADIFGKGE